MQSSEQRWVYRLINYHDERDRKGHVYSRKNTDEYITWMAESLEASQAKQNQAIARDDDGKYYQV